ncbi:hypothetical protein PHLGIDRAFT_36447 [Phlebiopsis gigantea 11061_1 CR5-6]|uniref:C2H2-type domain-containing protein n=1 Tax=Phlebiopsis gigantea (strain 11061_1 CR5-6) TaxID=745531 RepID=A0A0C3NK98_PHLG1|nr:hypothetical protein PHLGIDRAFT_36447 [Phlebiopsis gigantea 11061_1 CR5-6]
MSYTVPSQRPNLLSSIPPSSCPTPQFDDPRSTSPSTESSSLSSRPATPIDDYGPIFALEQDFCSNFACCGLTLPDMHALLDHFEESHVVVLGDDGRPVYPTPPSPSRTRTAESPYDQYHPHLAGRSSSRAPVASIVIDYPNPFPPATHTPSAGLPEYGLGLYPYEIKGAYPDIADPYDPFGFEATRALQLDADPPSPSTSAGLSSAGASAFSSPATSAFSSPATSAFPSPATSAFPSPARSAFPSPSLRPTCLPPALLSLPERAAPHVPYYLQGTARAQSPDALPPSISRARTAAPASAPSPAPAPASSPAPRPPHTPTSASTPAKVKARLLDAAPKPSARRLREREREKAYACPHAACTKRYLNPNGLKYHLEKGTCTAPGPRPLRSVLPSPA